MKKKEKAHVTEILELLESDDELPDSYIEIPDIPAYQDDHRFEPCDPTAFKWLHQKLNDDSKITQTRNVLEQEHCNNVAEQERHANDETLHTEEDLLNEQILETNEETTTNTRSTHLKNKNKILISKGVLSKRNIFLIKSIEQYSTDTTLLWFIEFLIHKEIKCYQRSCLVGDMIKDYNGMAVQEPLADFNKKYSFNLVVH